MGCKCNVMESIVAIVILIFAFWPTTASTWIIAIAAIALLIHSLTCPNCKMHKSGGMNVSMPMQSSRKKRK